MFSNLGLKDKSILIVMLIIISLSSVFIYLNVLEHKYGLNFFLEKKEDRLNKFLEVNLEDISSFYIARANANINSFGIREAIETKDIKKIYDLTLPRFKVLTKENPFLKEMRFYSNDNTLITNMSDFNKTDTIATLLAKRVNDTKAKDFAFQFIDNRLYYSIAIPIEYKNRHIGVLEFSINPHQFVEKINQIFIDIHSVILIKNEDKFSISNCCINSNSKLYEKIFDNMNREEPHSILDFDDEHYIIHNHLNLEDVYGRALADLVLIQNITEDVNVSYKMLIYSIIATIIIVLIVFWLLQNSFGRVVRKIELKDLELEKFVEELELVVAQRTKELKESREKYKNIVNLTSEGYLEFGKNKKIIDVNEALCEILGFSKDEIIGKTPFDFMNEKNSKIFEDEISKVTTVKNRVFEVTLKSRDKRDIHTIFSATVIKSKKLMIFAFVTDITKQQKLLEEMKERKISDIKLASIGKLAAGVTHEINTPLTYIKGNLELMKFEIESMDETQSKEMLLSVLSVIFEGVTRINGIINAMKEVSGKSSNKKELTNIYSTLIVALKMVYNRSKHISNIYINDNLFTLDLDINSEEYYSVVDRQRIEQVWIVILNNAIDEFTKLNMEFEDKFIGIDIKKENGNIHIFIKDNAGAIPSNILDKIFEPFMSTKVDKGMGLGLNIAKKIIKDNGGEIKAYNDETLGDLAIFEIILNANEYV